MTTTEKQHALSCDRAAPFLLNDFKVVLLLLLIALPAALMSSLPANARFLSPDTYDPWLQGVDINRYAYGNNDPINNSDPSGRSFLENVRDLFRSPDERDAHYNSMVESYRKGLETLDRVYKSPDSAMTEEQYTKQRAQMLKSMGYYKSLIGRTDDDVAVDTARDGALAAIAGMGARIGIPGRVQSRINVSKDGMKHVVDGHFNPMRAGKSQFTISQDELASLLNSKKVVSANPVALSSGNFARTVDTGQTVGTLARTGQSTTIMTVITDETGELISAFPGSL